MRGLGVDVGVAPDAGHNLPRGQAGVVRVTAFEHTADNAFLAPHGARRQVAVGGQAGDFCTGACAARRPVVRLAWAEYEITAVDAGPGRVGEPLDMIDRRAVAPGDVVRLERAASGPGGRGQPGTGRPPSRDRGC